MRHRSVPGNVVLIMQAKCKATVKHITLLGELTYESNACMLDIASLLQILGEEC